MHSTAEVVGYHEHLEARIVNFKTIEDLKLQIAPVTVLIGPPASGKSNILEALAIPGYLHKFCESEDYMSIDEVPALFDIVRAERVDDLFFYGEKRRTIEVSISGARVKLFMERGELKAAINDAATLEPIPKLSVKRGLPVKLTLHKPPKPVPQSIVLKGSSFASEDALGLKIVSRLYSFDRFEVLKAFAQGKGCEAQPRGYLDEAARNLYQVTKSCRSVVKILNAVYRELGVTLEARVLRDGLIVVFDQEFEVSERSVSDTFYRLAYYLYAIYSNYDYASIYGLEGNLILLLEEPESHVFPYAARVLAEHISQTSDKLRYIITTHNPHLLGVLMDKVKDILVYYVYRDERGRTRACRVDVERLASELVDAYELLAYRPKELLESGLLVEEH